jgi:hypothetical protein
VTTEEFFRTVFGNDEGFLFISTKADPSDDEITIHKPFQYPQNLKQAIAYASMREDEDVYFSPMLYSVPRRKAVSVKHTPVVYADTDAFPIDGFVVPPSINIETSPGRHASLWVLDRSDYDKEEVQAAARAIALTHASTVDGKQMGTDPGGWDLTQLLRLPNSMNLKYLVPKHADSYEGPFRVQLSANSPGHVYTLEEIQTAYSPENLPELPQRSDMDMPEALPAPADVLRRITASRSLSDLYSKEPHRGQDWSDTLYYFICEMLRSGFTAEEAFVGAWYAECNKYKRDGRPMSDLWDYDMKKALADPANRPRSTVDREANSGEAFARPREEGIAAEIELALLGPDQHPSVTFIDHYVEWATSKTDAPEAYHIAGALTILSLVFGEWGVLYPQWGETRLGLFIVIMGETTDTRKTTSRNLMKKFMRMMQTGDYEYILTSDATGEALLDTLAERPHLSSLYDRDEAQQLIADIKGAKGYLKGFFETLNEFYDGWAHGRLRAGKRTKDTPVNFVQYLMGIRSQIQDNLELSDFASGWGPRNIYVRGESPPRTRENSRLRQGVPGQSSNDEHMTRLVIELTEVRNFWESEAKGDKANPTVIPFAEDAWLSMTDLEWDLKEHFKSHPRYDTLKPCFERLTVNAMKVAVLFAMADKRTQVSLQDVINTRYYAAQWVEDLLIVVEGVNESLYLRDMNKLTQYIIDHDGLVTYAAALRWATNNGKNRKEFIDIVDALIDADVIDVVTDKTGKRSLAIL